MLQKFILGAHMSTFSRQNCLFNGFFKENTILKGVFSTKMPCPVGKRVPIHRSGYLFSVFGVNSHANTRPLFPSGSHLGDPGPHRVFGSPFDVLGPLFLNFRLRDDWKYQNGCFFGKVPKGGGGHFQSKNFYCRFWTFKQGFLSMKMIQKGHFRVCFSTNYHVELLYHMHLMGNRII